MCFLPLGQQNGTILSCFTRGSFMFLPFINSSRDAFFQSRLLFVILDTYSVGISSVLNAYSLDTGVHISLELGVFMVSCQLFNVSASLGKHVS